MTPRGAERASEPERTQPTTYSQLVVAGEASGRSHVSSQTIEVGSPRTGHTHS